jgi:hypothetical protein
VLVGITPGTQQTRNALVAVRAALLSGATATEALATANRTASFSGAMRSNLVAMLDRIGLHEVLGIDSCAQVEDGYRRGRGPMVVRGQQAAREIPTKTRGRGRFAGKRGPKASLFRGSGAGRATGKRAGSRIGRSLATYGCPASNLCVPG